MNIEGVALPAAAFRKWVLDTFPGEFAGVGPFQGKEEAYPFLRVTQIGGQPEEGHASLIQAYLQVQVFHEPGEQWEGYVLASKLAQAIVGKMPGYRCEYGAVHRVYAVNGPMWIQPLSSDDDGGYTADFVIYFRPDKLV